MKDVVVAEDDPAVREVLALLLEEEGYSVRAVPDGLAALAEVGRRVPDLVIADVQMPRLAGFALLARLREHHPDLPVLLLSAALREDPPVGATFVAKPFDVDHLLEVVARLLGGTGGG